MFLVTPQAFASCINAELISPSCGKTPSSTFDVKSKLWTVFVQGKHAYVAHSKDYGNTYSTAVKVNDKPEGIYTNGENRPKIAIDNNGYIYTTWTQKTAGRFNGDIRFTRSTDGGKNFEDIRTINDDGLAIGHRFDELFISESGNIYIAWLDKRNKVKAKNDNNAFGGISLFYSISSNQGKTFSANSKVADHTCECCRLSMTSEGSDNAKIFWRHMFNKNTRDHAIATLSPDSAINFNRASIDDWQTDSCPHHGPDIDNASNGNYHLTWFSNGNLHKGIYYGQYDATEKKTINIMSVDEQPGASHPQVKESGKTTWLIWKRYENSLTHLKIRHSHDAGKSWSQPASIAATGGASDHPSFISNTDDSLYISWHTSNNNFKLIPVNDKAKASVSVDNHVDNDE